MRRFVILGDFGARHEDRNVRVGLALRNFLDDAAEPHVPTAVLLLGDNFYPRGLVGTAGTCRRANDTAEVTAQIEAVLGPFAFLRERGIPILAVPGNHDHACGADGLRNQVELDRFLAPQERWGPLWRLYSGPPSALAFEDASLQVVLVDSEPMLQDSRVLRSSLERLDDLVRDGRSRFRWQIVAAHHPLRTAGTHDGAFPDGLRKPVTLLLFPTHLLAAANLPPFRALSQEAYSFRYRRYRSGLEGVLRRNPGAVDLFLAGHDHSLQLLGAREAGFPMELVVGSGAYCSPVREGSPAVFATAKHGFAVVDVATRMMRVRIYGTSPCGEREICPAGSGKAYLLYETFLEGAPRDGTAD